MKAVVSKADVHSGIVLMNTERVDLQQVYDRLVLASDPVRGGNMWHGRAAAMLEALIPCWSALGHIVDRGISLQVLQQSMRMPAMVELLTAPQVDHALRESVRNWLADLPGFRADKGGAQGATTQDQLGFVAATVLAVVRFIAHQERLAA